MQRGKSIKDQNFFDDLIFYNFLELQIWSQFKEIILAQSLNDRILPKYQRYMLRFGLDIT